MLVHPFRVVEEEEIRPSPGVETAGY